MQGTISKWLMAMAGLGAAYMVLANPNAFYKAAQGVQTVVGGTEVSIITGGKK